MPRLKLAGRLVDIPGSTSAVELGDRILEVERRLIVDNGVNFAELIAAGHCCICTAPLPDNARSPWCGPRCAEEIHDFDTVAELAALLRTGGTRH